jgi:hypothetical protein
MSADDLSASIRSEQDSAAREWLESELESSPFAALTERQRAIVFAAEDLYETGRRPHKTSAPLTYSRRSFSIPMYDLMTRRLLQRWCT